MNTTNQNADTRHKCTRVEKRAGVLRFSLNHAWTVRKRFPDALFLEFGVHQGKDICRIAAFLREKERQENTNTTRRKQSQSQNHVETSTSTTKKSTIVHGFDSFQGLPEDWDNGQREYEYNYNVSDSNNVNVSSKLAFGVGKFDLGGVVPVMASVQKQLGASKFFALHDDTSNNDDNDNNSCNVELHAGWFQDTVSNFFDTHATATGQPVAFLHADADLYSSTICFLEEICRRRLLVEGSVITFDEYANYPSWEQGEYKAWMEISTQYGLKWRYLCFHAPRSSVAGDKNAWSHYGYQSVSVVITGFG